MVATAVLATAIISLFVISTNADVITSVDVISSPSAGQQCPPRYIRVNQDLNQGSGGHYIYLCYSTDPIFGDAVTEILVVASTSGSVVTPYGYTLIPEDLNKGAKGKYIYLMYSKIGYIPLKGIDVIAGDNASIRAPPGWIKNFQDLNEGSGGKHIYFVYTYNWCSGTCTEPAFIANYICIYCIFSLSMYSFGPAT